MPDMHSPQYLEFVARLRGARKARRITQAHLASLLNKPQSYVSKVETCERRIDLIEAAKWCKALGITLDDVLTPDLRSVSHTNVDIEETLK